MAKKDIGVKVIDTLKDTSRTIKKTVQDVKVPNQVKNIVKKPEDKGAVLKKQVAEKEREQKEKEEDAVIISPFSALKIFYFLMAVDGHVSSEEEEKFDSIGNELDPLFEKHKEIIINVCKAQLEKANGESETYNTIIEGIEHSVSVAQDTEQGVIPPLFLIWNLLTIAYSDGIYEEKERQLINYLVELLKVKRDLYLEMENSYTAIWDIEKEINWIKTTNKPYLTIEAMVKELEKRRDAIFESVKALVLL